MEFSASGDDGFSLQALKIQPTTGSLDSEIEWMPQQVVRRRQLSSSYVRLDAQQDCPNNTRITDGPTCLAAAYALGLSPHVALSTNNNYNHGDNLPYGCTYRIIDNDVMFNQQGETVTYTTLTNRQAVCYSIAPPPPPITWVRAV